MDAGLGRGGMEFGLGRGGMPDGLLGRGPPAPAAGGRCCWPPWMPNGLLPAPRAGGRPPGRAPGPGAGVLGRAAGEPGRGGIAAGPGRGPGRLPPSAGGSRRTGLSRCCWRAACAALTAASCSAFNAAARASAAATSMSCALAGLATGAAGCGAPGTGPFGFGPGAGAAGRRGGIGLAETRGAPGSGTSSGSVSKPASTRAPTGRPEPELRRTRRMRYAAVGRRAPRRCWTRTSRTRPFPSAWRERSYSRPRALLQARVRGPCLPLHSSLRGRAGSTRSDLTRALEAWSFQGLHRVLMSVVLPC